MDSYGAQNWLNYEVYVRSFSADVLCFHAFLLHLIHDLNPIFHFSTCFILDQVDRQTQEMLKQEQKKNRQRRKKQKG